jgi:hypothetical protein
MADDKQQVRNQFRHLAEQAKLLKKTIGESNEIMGYVADATANLEKSAEVIVKASTQQELQPTIVSIKAMASSLAEHLNHIDPLAIHLRFKIDEVVSSFANTASTMATTCNTLSLIVNPPTFQPCPFLADSDVEKCSAKLSLIDPSLSATYKGAWSAFYTQEHDPKRAALWQMRQTFDHFFESLAPNDQVRTSPHWTPKEGDKRDSIHRSERLSFAAHRFINDKTTRETFVEAGKEQLRNYERLNQAHGRGELSQEKASEAFKATDQIIKSWLEAIEEWPPKQVTEVNGSSRPASPHR